MAVEDVEEMRSFSIERGETQKSLPHPVFLKSVPVASFVGRMLYGNLLR